MDRKQRFSYNGGLAKLSLRDVRMALEKDIGRGVGVGVKGDVGALIWCSCLELSVSVEWL